MINEKFSFSVNSIHTQCLHEFRNFSPFNIYTVSHFASPKDNSLIYSKSFNDEIISYLRNTENSVIILPIEAKNKIYLLQKNNFFIFSEKPKIEFGKILSQIISKPSFNSYKKTELNSYISSNSIIGKNVTIEPFVHIEDNVIIEDNCLIKAGARINRYSFIGISSVIGNNTVVGSPGFDIEIDNDGKTYQVPHLGGVVLKNNVSVGPFSVISQGRISPTFIHEFVKIDSSVVIASDVEIKNSSIIAAHSVISNATKIGRKTWIGPGSVISNNLQIGDNVKISLGSIVVDNIKDGSSVSSAFAIEHEKNLEKYLNER